ncbi:MAG: hypothetical protein KIT61_18100 [Pyrinomonadaceae bacterium]|nr:hypothetical protein [Pyrinomonadaceae bacterium]
MNPSEHLTRNQIAAFSAGSLAANESRSIGGHLIRCVECRGLLPLPDAGKFWTAVMGEEDSQISQVNDESAYSIPPYIRAFGRFFSKPNGLAWSGGALVVILGLALVLLFSASNESSVESEVAKSFEIENPVSTPSHDQAKEPNVVVRDRAKENDHKDHPPDRVSTEQRSPGTRQKQNSKGPSDNRGAAARSVSGGVSSTRGAISKCGTERTFEMKLRYAETDLVLRWQRVPNAAKYHLYVSDDEEILIDEFETENATSYLLKKQLDPKKSYKWKVLITLENGQVIVADSQKFTSEDIRSVQDKVSSKRQRSVTRCSESQ